MHKNKIRIIGHNIYRIAKEKNINLSSIANHCGLSIRDIQRLCEGRLIMTPKELESILSVLECDFSKLITDRQEPYGECFGRFKDLSNEDMILDMFDEYILLHEGVL